MLHRDAESQKKLDTGLARAEAEGWLEFVRTDSDRQALIEGCYFDWDAAQDASEFIETFCIVPKGVGAGEPFKLLDFQKNDIIWPLFGWMRENGYRRHSRVYTQMAKKNGKTALASAIGLYLLYADDELGSEIYCFANVKEQASLIVKTAMEMVRSSPFLEQQTMAIVPSTLRIVKDTQSWFAAQSSLKDSKDGPNYHAAIIDEFHEWGGSSGARDLYRKIRYAGLARTQPIVPFIITTPGDDQYTLCFEQYTYAKAVLSGETIDTSLLVCIYEPDMKRLEEDPTFWKTEECWKQGNPAYPILLSKKDFEQDIAEVENSPVEKSGFFRYRLGVWVQADSPWIDIEVWDANAGVVDEVELAGSECYGGLDLASTNDTTAWVLIFPKTGIDGESTYKVLPRVFVPQATALERARKGVTPYDFWIDEGWLQATAGDVIDHERVLNQILTDIKMFNVKQIAYDRALSSWIIGRLQAEAPQVELIPFGQTPQYMSSPVKELYAALKQRRVEHGGHPVLRWMASNAVAESDRYENVILTKKKSKDKIDGIIATIMGFALCRKALGVGGGFNPYNDPEFLRQMREGRRDTQTNDQTNDN